MDPGPNPDYQVNSDTATDGKKNIPDTGGSGSATLFIFKWVQESSRKIQKQQQQGSKQQF